MESGPPEKSLCMDVQQVYDSENTERGNDLALSVNNNNANLYDRLWKERRSALR